MRNWTRRSVVAAGLAAAGCAVVDRPRLGVMYGGVTRPADQPPLILIPGAFGSSLREKRTGREIWPASDARLLLGNFRELELPAGTLQLVVDHFREHGLPTEPQ